MIVDMENGEIGIIVTKDLSRLGRNQLHTGLYIEERFPMFGVRYIAINDNVDTENAESNDLMPFKNLFNEWFIRDTSRKIRAVQKAKAERGERLGTRAPYGYTKDPETKKLIIDEEAAAVVKRIFALCAAGNGPSQIARILKKEQVLTPTMYAYAKYGMTRAQIAEAFRLLKAKGAEEFGIHAFLASNTLSNEYYPALARMLFRLAAELQQETGCHITFIDLSGGVGIPYRPDEPANDIAVIGEGVRRAYEEILVPAGMGDVALYTELGRFMLAPYGHLVTRAIHAKHIYKEYIGTDACACDLMRPAMYGSYHHITVMGKEDAPCDHKYDIVGGLCENNDKFAVDRMLPGIDIGDLLVIHDAGAHGLAMGYNYNGKLRCAEVLLQPDGSTRLIRRAETPEDYFATMVWDD